MNVNWRRRVGLILLSASLILGMLSGVAVYAAADNIEVIFTDVTSTDQTTLAGEAKIKVSVKGAGGDVTIAQMALIFNGDLKYKSIEFLQGGNNPAAGNAYVTPNGAYANSKKEIDASIICAVNPMTFTDDETDLFVLTFNGKAGDTVNLSLDKSTTYCTVNGVDIIPLDNTSKTATASSKNVVGKDAVVTLTMDKVTDFAPNGKSGYESSNVTLTVTSENPEHRGYTMHTVLNNILISKGGHRENTSMPTFTVTNKVLDGDTYTVELSGIGYVPYVVTGVTFDEILNITNDDFVPGDINNDGTVDAVDKKMCSDFISKKTYNEAADFNRDGKVNDHDIVVFSEIEDSDEETTAEKMNTPSLVAGVKSFTVNWTKPSENVTGYVIKYGTSNGNLNSTVEITSADATSKTISGLLAETTYYVSIAAKNTVGTGEFSNTVSVATLKESTPPAGGGGGAAPTKPKDEAEDTEDNITVEDTDVPNNTDLSVKSESFTDIENYGWAKDSIYMLKEAGVISGVSETEYAPANNIKRGDFILILTRMLKTEAEANGNFADVPAGSYYYDAIAKAKAAGIATGDGVSFMPEKTITRQDLITLAYRAFLAEGLISENTDISVLDSFNDKNNISEYAKTAMASMVSAGIIKGDNGKVNPLGNATRAEVAVMCARLMELKNND